jgi:hypothetical protein
VSYVEGAQLPHVEDGQQDAFAVADLLRQDAAAGAGRAAPSLMSEVFGQGAPGVKRASG